MPANYPTSVWSPTTKNAGDTIQPSHINDAQTEIVAIEAGLTQGTAPLNSSHSTFASVSVTGGSTLATLQVTGGSTFAGQMTLNAIPYTMPSSGGSTGNVLTCVSTSGSTMGLEWRTVNPTLALLRAATGTDTNAAATTVDSIAVSGLTAKDTLMVITSLDTSSQATAQAVLYHATDAVNLAPQTFNPLPANTGSVATNYLTQRQGNSTGIAGFVTFGQTNSTSLTQVTFANVTTAWTGAWTLGLRHGGVTAGGTFKYAWSVYKVAGQ